MLPRVPHSDLPPRELTDPRALRAVAHPVRVRLLEELAFGGAATATELSDRIGESPANCSWHLRQLAKYGFVEETGGGTGRQRPWQIVIQEKHLPHGNVDEELRIASTAFRRQLVSREYEALRAWLATMHAEPARWRDSAFITQNAGWCTAEELAQVFTDVATAMDRFVHRINDPASRPPGARAVRFLAWGVPAQPLPISEDPDSRDP
jgi:DNA-binding transcriptional ArsR family regulator